MKLSRRQDSIKSSTAISRVRCINETDVSRTISFLIIRDMSHPRNVGFIYTSDVSDCHTRRYQKLPLLAEMCIRLLLVLSEVLMDLETHSAGYGNTALATCITTSAFRMAIAH
jgi:hypothetical protein